MDNFVGTFCISFDGPVAKYMQFDAGGPDFKSIVLCLQLFHYDILGRLGSNLVFIISFGIIVPDRIT
jgi:hypothetical protein